MGMPLLTTRRRPWSIVHHAPPTFRFATFTDLHIGATITQHWHNRFLTD